MSSYYGYYLYDYAKYRDKIVPALKAGESHPLVQKYVKKLEEKNKRGVVLPDTRQVEAWFSGGASTYNIKDDFYQLFETMLTFEAITHYINWRKRYVAASSLLIDDLPLDSTTRELVRTLDGLGKLWGDLDHHLALLTAEETGLLWLGLDSVTLDINNQQDDYLKKIFQDYHDNQPEYVDSDYAALTAFCNATKLAAELGYGVMWGRENTILYYVDDMFAPSATRPEQLAWQNQG